MFGLGTIINTAAVVFGGLIGITLKKGISEKCSQILMQACGVATIFIGGGGVFQRMLVINGDHLETQGTLLLIFSLVAGSFLGNLFDIERRVEQLGEFLKRKFHTEGDAHFVEGFMACTLVICIGAMAIVGAIEDGLTGNYSTLTAKAILDFVIVVIFASAMGKGVIFSALPLFVYQGAITCAAAAFGDVMSEAMIGSISYVGSALIFCVGINIAFGKKFPVGNMLPAMFLPVLYHALAGMF